MNGPEQRTAARHLLEWKAFFGEKDLAQAGFTKNVSETGAFIAAPLLPKLGALIRVRFEAPASQRPVLLAQVVRHTSPSNGQGFGVKLISDRASMRQLIESAQKPKLAMVPKPRTELVQVVSTKEYESMRTAELALGGLSFTSPKAITINQTSEVEVAFLWNGRSVAVRGRVVRCDELGGRFRAILLMDDVPETLAKLDLAAAAR